MKIKRDNGAEHVPAQVGPSLFLDRSLSPCLGPMIICFLAKAKKQMIIDGKSDNCDSAESLRLMLTLSLNLLTSCISIKMTEL